MKLAGVCILTVGIAAAVLTPGPAQAGFPVSRDMKCAVGGEKFRFGTTGSYSSWGSRPDGKPFGSWEFPIELPACPKNRLVMYRTFEKDEKVRLRAFLNTAEFRAVRDETTYYRASVLASFLEDDTPYFPLSLLLQASWQTYDTQKARYQREFANRVAALETDHSNEDWYALTARAANAWRELGEFDRARETLASLPDTYPSPATDPSVIQIGDPDATAKFWQEYRTGLLAEIDAGNAESEPVAMLPLRVRASRCLRLEKRTEQPLPAACSAPELQEELERQRTSRGRFD